MCGLYGFSSYNDRPISDIARLTNALAVQSAVRGTDATGIAFVTAATSMYKSIPRLPTRWSSSLLWVFVR